MSTNRRLLEKQKKKLERLDKRRQAINLRIYGKMTYAEIGDVLSVTPATVKNWVDNYQDEVFNKTINDLIQERDRKYGQLEDVVNQSKLDGDLQATIRAIQEQIKLLGLREVEEELDGILDDIDYDNPDQQTIEAIENILSERY